MIASEIPHHLSDLDRKFRNRVNRVKLTAFASLTLLAGVAAYELNTQRLQYLEQTQAYFDSLPDPIQDRVLEGLHDGFTTYVKDQQVGPNHLYRVTRVQFTVDGRGVGLGAMEDDFVLDSQGQQVDDGGPPYTMSPLSDASVHTVESMIQGATAFGPLAPPQKELGLAK